MVRGWRTQRTNYLSIVCYCLGFNDFYNMIFDPKEELIPHTPVPASTSNHVPYYAPNQTERSNLLVQQAAQQVSPDQDKIHQLELVSHTAYTLKQ